MNSENIKVSVIVPMYNAEEYVQETIESLLSQTLQGIEIILIDDQSTDQTYAIASHFASQYDNIILHKQSINRGVSVARNTGLDLAKGQFIFFIDADDTISSDTLQLMYTAGVEKEVDIVTGVYERFDSKSSTVMNFFYQFQELQEEGYKSIYTCPALLYSVYCWGKLFNAKLIEDIRFKEDISFAEDHLFTIEAFLKTEKVYNLSVNVYNYRTREGDTTSATQSIYNDPIKNLNQLITVLNEIENLFRKSIKKDKNWETLYGVYFTRVIHWNIWTALSNGLLSNNASNRIKVLEIYMSWLENLDKQIIENNKNDLEIVNLKIKKIETVMDFKTKELWTKSLASIDLLFNYSKCSSDSDIPKITIQTVAYNVESYIIECIESVLQQSFTNFEWIILDNGSTDKTSEILKEYASKDDRIKLYKSETNNIINHEKLNINFTNKILNLESEYWCVLDSDDVLHKDFLKDLYSSAEYYNADIAVAGTEKFFENGQPSELRRSKNFFISDSKDLGTFFPEMYFMFTVYWGKLVKVKLLQELLEYRNYNFQLLKHADDTLFSLEMLQFSKGIVGIDKTLHYYRIRNNSYYHSQIDENRFMDYIIIYQKNKYLLQSWGELTEENLKFLTSKLFHSVTVCLELIIKSHKIKTDQKFAWLEKIINNEIFFQAIKDVGFVEYLFSFINDLIKNLISEVDEKDFPSILKSYIYKLYTAIELANSSNGNNQTAFLLYLSAICDKENKNYFGSLLFSSFLSIIEKSPFSNLLYTEKQIDIIISTPDLLYEVVNSSFGNAISICDRYSQDEDYKSLKLLLSNQPIDIQKQLAGMNSDLFTYINDEKIEDAIELLINILDYAPVNKEALLYKYELLKNDNDIVSAFIIAEALRVFYSNDKKAQHILNSLDGIYN